MACCCKTGTKPSAACLGRCDMPKHRCLEKEDVKPAPIPPHMGWLYNAKDSPSHQLRCGWRPGHISCSVLKRIESNRCGVCGGCPSCGACSPCPSSATARRPSSAKARPQTCRPSPCRSPCPRQCPSGATSRCVAVFPSQSPCKTPSGQPLIRIIRHAGQYSICTKPSNVSNAPSGPYPLKYVLNTDPSEHIPDDAKFSVEAKYNDYRFDYTSSQSSFVLDFSPPETKCQD